MFEVQRIDSLDAPEMAPFREMRGQVEQRKGGIFVAESDKVVRRLLESELTVVSLLLPEKWLRQFEPLLEKRPETVRVYFLEKKELERLTGFTFYQGVLGVGKVPESPTLPELLAKAAPPRLFMAVEMLSNAENLGSMVRSGAAFGIHGLLADRTSSSPYLRRAVRASMGTVFHVPVIENLHLVETVRQFQSSGVRCIAAHPRANGPDFPDVDLTTDCCFIFGSEGYGISPALLEACDLAVSIPMPPTVDSLNVGNAAAVFLYEARRQRGFAGTR